MLSFNNPISDFSSERLKEIRDMITGKYDCDELLFISYRGYALARAYKEGLGYMISYPIDISAEVPISEVLSDVYSYCLTQDIPEVYFAVPADAVPYVIRGTTLAEIYAATPTRDECIVTLKNELSYASEHTSYNLFGLRLSALAMKDMDDYIRLSSDKKYNRYYGYDILEDMKGSSKREIFEYISQELRLSRSLVLAVRDGRHFIGEGVLCNPDNRGGICVSFRVVRSRSGRGYGKKILRSLIIIAEQLGFSHVSADVHRDNAASIAVCMAEGMRQTFGEEQSEIWGFRLDF